MLDFSPFAINNLTLQCKYCMASNYQVSPFSQILLPLSIFSLFTYRNFKFPFDSKIVHFSPLRIVESHVSMLDLQSHSSLFIDRTVFEKHSKTINSIDASVISITHCSFSETDSQPFYSEGSKNMQIKWNSFQDILNNRAISIINAKNAKIITNNFTNLESGGILSRSSKIKVRDCIFFKNEGSNGGAIEFDDSEASVSFCAFQECESSKGGALYYNNEYSNSNLLIENSLFSKNSAVSGSSIFSNSKFTILNCNFTGNRAKELKITNNAEITESNLFFDSFDFHLKFGPSPSSTFSPSPSQSLIPIAEDRTDEGWSRNTKIIVGCCVGIGAIIIIIVIVFIVVVKVRAYNNPKIYVAEKTTEGQQPTGTTYVSNSYSLK